MPAGPVDVGGFAEGEEEGEKEEGGEEKDVKSSEETYDEDEEEKWRRNGGSRSDRHHPAYGSRDDDKDSGYGSSQSGQTSGDSQDGKSSKAESEYRKLRERYSPQEIALLQHLQDRIRGLVGFHGSHRFVTVRVEFLAQRLFSVGAELGKARESVEV